MSEMVKWLLQKDWLLPNWGWLSMVLGFLLLLSFAVGFAFSESSARANIRDLLDNEYNDSDLEKEKSKGKKNGKDK